MYMYMYLFFCMYCRCDRQVYPVYVRSISNLVPLFSCLTFEKEVVSKLPRFKEMVANIEKEKYEQYKDQVYM